jgi:hypothetical protein
VVLGEPGCAWEEEEGETALGLDGEKVFSPYCDEAVSGEFKKTFASV